MTETGFSEVGTKIREGGGKGERGLCILMSYEKKKTRFSKLIRIDPKQYEWIKSNKDTNTCAGYLDKIINSYKGQDETH